MVDVSVVRCLFTSERARVLPPQEEERRGGTGKRTTVTRRDAEHNPQPPHAQALRTNADPSDASGRQTEHQTLLPKRTKNLIISLPRLSALPLSLLSPRAEKRARERERARQPSWRRPQCQQVDRTCKRSNPTRRRRSWRSRSTRPTASARDSARPPPPATPRWPPRSPSRLPSPRPPPWRATSPPPPRPCTAPWPSCPRRSTAPRPPARGARPPPPAASGGRCPAARLGGRRAAPWTALWRRTCTARGARGWRTRSAPRPGWPGARRSGRRTRRCTACCSR